MQTINQYKETCRYYHSNSGNIQIYIYRRKKKSVLHRFIKHLLANNCYYLKQKTLGIIFVIIAMFCPFVLDGDITVSFFMLPLGTWLIFTKKKATMF